MVVAFEAGDLDGTEQAKAARLVEECPACADLLADLAAIRLATAALPAAPRTRDFRLTEADARRLSPTPWRSFLRWLAAPGSSVRPLAGGLATLGIVGALLTASPTLPERGERRCAAGRPVHWWRRARPGAGQGRRRNHRPGPEPPTRCRRLGGRDGRPDHRPGSSPGAVWHEQHSKPRRVRGRPVRACQRPGTRSRHGQHGQRRTCGRGFREPAGPRSPAVPRAGRGRSGSNRPLRALARAPRRRGLAPRGPDPRAPGRGPLIIPGAVLDPVPPPHDRAPAGSMTSGRSGGTGRRDGLKHR